MSRSLNIFVFCEFFINFECLKIETSHLNEDTGGIKHLSFAFLNERMAAGKMDTAHVLGLLVIAVISVLREY